MVPKQLLIAAVGLFALPCIAPAIGIGVIGGDPPDPLSVLTELNEVQATSGVCDENGDCTFVFNNDTGNIITSLSFSMTIATGLTQAEIASAFSCSQGEGGVVGPLGYFLTCGESYNPLSGLLTYSFSGVNPPILGESCPSGNCTPSETGGPTGIPPDTVPTDPEFSIVLTGWVSTATVSDPISLFPNGLPTFADTFTDAPEPSTFVFVAIAFLITAGAVQFRRRRLAASRRSA